MLVAHVNGHCMETCVSSKLLFFFCIRISPRKIFFNIVGHGIDPIVEVLPPCLWTLHILHLYDNEFDDEELDEDDIEKPWVVNMGELLTLDDISPNVEREKAHNQPLISNTHKRALAQIDDVVQEITNEVKEGMGFNSLTMPHHYCVWLH